MLVTGAAGNIGSALVRRLLANDVIDILGVDNLSTGDLKKIPPPSKNFGFIKADVNDPSEMREILMTEKVDVIFHLAAVVGVQRTLENPLSVLKDIDGIRNVCALATEFGISRIYYASSSEIYGEATSELQNEVKTPLNSRLPYAIVKNLGEAYLGAYNKSHGLGYTSFRFFNTYGPRQSEDFVLPRFVRSALRGEPLRIYGDGAQTRTFCYVDDTVEVMYQCLIGEYFKNDVINVGSDREISIIDLAKLVIRLTNSSSRILHVQPLKEGDMRRRCPDISRMKTVLKRDPIELGEGIIRLTKHYGSECLT